MKILDALKSARHKPEGRQSPEPVSPEPLSEPQPSIQPESPAELWFSLCNNPNQDDLLPRLLQVCRKKGGPSAEYAALTELSNLEGSWLPQVYLGRSALEAKHYEEASDWYDQALSPDEPSDYALFMISADMGRLGFASEMPELILPLFSPQKNNPYIGLNVLEAFREKGRKNEGLALLERMRPYENDEIRDFLDGFETAFATMPEPVLQPQTLTKQEPDAEKTGEMSSETVTASEPDAGAEPSSIPVADKEEAVLYSASEMPEDPQAQEASQEPKIPAPATRPIMLDLPVWAHGLIGLQDLLPNTVDKPRVGVYMYANTTSAARRAELAEEAVDPDTLAVSLPMAIAERLLFTSSYKPVTLFPVVRDKGPFGGNLEPDVQGLFGLCSKEALDYLVTGTIYQDQSILRIRTWILDRTKQSARVVAADVPATRCGEAFLSMMQEILLVFAERHGARGTGRSELTYMTWPVDTVSRYLRATKDLVHLYLVRQNECDSTILTDFDQTLTVFSELVGAEPKNQVYFSMLLSAMLYSRKFGHKDYQMHRQLMYEVADKNRYTPCVKAVMKEVNLVLQD